jgi:potassium-dependent mechanosensitive channel
MSIQRLIKTSLILLFVCLNIQAEIFAAVLPVEQEATIDKVQMVTQQINLLQNRMINSQHELVDLQKQYDKEMKQLSLNKISKGLIEKALLDISLAKSNLESIAIELSDSEQTRNWLEKNIQEIENQLNVIGVFGLKVAQSGVMNTQELRTDLAYQKKLFALEKVRMEALHTLQMLANTNVQLRMDRFNRLDKLLKSRRMMRIKQQEAKDELAYQQQHNYWLNQINILNARLSKLDPQRAKSAYASLERDIFYANESAHFSYIQSLISRYQDQIQQMKMTVVKNNSISLLNEMGNQVLQLAKQVNRLDGVLKSRASALKKLIAYLAQRKKEEPQLSSYLIKIEALLEQYQVSDGLLIQLSKNLFNFRQTLDIALQAELSSRQSLPEFGMKTVLNLGKEMLLLPTLTFQVIKSLSAQVVQAFEATRFLGWSLFIFLESLALTIFFFCRNYLSMVLARPSPWRDRINSKWLSLQCLNRHFIDLFILGNLIAGLFYFHIPVQYFGFIFYLSMVWLIFRAILTIARLCLVEIMHDALGQTAAHDMRLYRALKWTMIVGGIITVLTVFLHQLPLIYELKALFDRLFLLLLMIASLFLLRSWNVLPNLIVSQMESQHPYLQKSVRLIGILIPLLMFANSVIGLFGYVNLIMTVSWYEGIFLIVLIGYLILRGLLSDGMEQLSRLTIQYLNNGWLWTEAFLKPIHKVLRIALFLVAWAVLFILYGWDKQSPIVERLTRLMHYQITEILNTTITPLNMLELAVVISVFYWTAKWTREFVFRLLLSRTKDMGIRNSISILSQYSVVAIGVFICLRVVGIDLRALAVVAGMLAFGVGLGLRDLANNFACGFLILLERPLRVGDIVNINGIEGDVTHIGSRAITVRTWDCMEFVVPNTEVFNKPFTNWTAKDNIVRIVASVKISRYDNPHEVKLIIQQVLSQHKDVLKDPASQVFLKSMSDNLMEFELRYFVNIRQVHSRTSVTSVVLLSIWDAFGEHGIKPPYPQHEIFLRNGELLKGA